MAIFTVRSAGYDKVREAQKAFEEDVLQALGIVWHSNTGTMGNEEGRMLGFFHGAKAVPTIFKTPVVRFDVNLTMAGPRYAASIKSKFRGLHRKMSKLPKDQRMVLQLVIRTGG